MSAGCFSLELGKCQGSGELISEGTFSLSHYKCAYNIVLITQKIIVQWHNVGYLKDVCCTKVPILTCRLRNGLINHLISIVNEKLWKAPVN